MMNSNANIKTHECTSTVLKEVFATKYRQSWNFLESILFSLTTGMTSNDNLRPHESTSKAKFQPKMSTAKGLYENLFNTESAKMQLFWSQLTSLQNLGDFQPLESTSKGYFKPKMSTSKV